MDSPKRNSSIIIPEKNDEEDDTPEQINSGKLVRNITKEIEKAIKSEMRDLNESLNFHSAKLDEVMECIHAFKQTIKVPERKNIDLTNKNNNLQIRVGALEQRLQEIEQEKLDKTVEIANVPSEDRKCEQLGQKRCFKTQTAPRRKQKCKNHKKKEGPANIQVQLQDESSQLKWILAAKSTKIIISDICPSERNNNNVVYIREAMTKTNKAILWTAKQELKNKRNFKYVWFKKGYVKARKDDDSNIYTLKSIEDVKVLITSNA